ncbi:MAG TPA: glycosyltransferase, partial [Steroidobacteraceae bacterium]|nr:glycosyltransferase [Steroidobacteraceae bacterium]
MTIQNTRTLISVVVPAYNEQTSVIECHARLTAVFAGIDVDYELLFVNDGSTDNTLSVLDSLRASDEHVSVVDLSRNFG